MLKVRLAVLLQLQIQRIGVNMATNYQLAKSTWIGSGMRGKFLKSPSRSKGSLGIRMRPPGHDAASILRKTVSWGSAGNYTRFESLASGNGDDGFFFLPYPHFDFWFMGANQKYVADSSGRHVSGGMCISTNGVFSFGGGGTTSYSVGSSGSTAFNYKTTEGRVPGTNAAGTSANWQETTAKYPSIFLGGKDNDYNINPSSGGDLAGIGYGICYYPDPSLRYVRVQLRTRDYSNDAQVLLVEIILWNTMGYYFDQATDYYSHQFDIRWGLQGVYGISATQSLSTRLQSGLRIEYPGSTYAVTALPDPTSTWAGSTSQSVVCVGGQDGLNWSVFPGYTVEGETWGQGF